MTRNPLVSIAVTAAAVAASLLLLTAGGQARSSGPRMLALTVSATHISTVDVPPLITSSHSPESPGDQVIARSRVSGSAAGRRYLTCTNTQTAPSVEQGLYACQLTYRLAGGTITAAGVVRLTGTTTAAITGGTGAYAGARGVLTSSGAHDTLSLQ